MALACDLCALHNSTVLDPPSRGWALSIGEQFTSFNTYKNAGDRSLPVNEWIQSSITNVVLAYGFSAPVRIEMVAPFIDRQFRRLKDQGIDRGNISGIGDMSIVGRYTPLDYVINDRSLVRLEVFAGFELPTGSTDELDDSDEEDSDTELHSDIPRVARPRHGGDAGPTGIHDEDLALGSGSLDFLVGMNAFATYRRLFATGGFQYGVRGPGDYGYDYANDFSFHLGTGGYLLVHTPLNFAIEVRMTGETKGNDSQRDETIPGSGVTALYLGPQLHGTFEDRLRLALGAQFPLLQNVSGLQLVPDYRILASIGWQF